MFSPDDQPLLTETTDAVLRRQLRLAANEAAAVAWTTPFPLLVLPVLLEEKSEEAQQYSRRQAEVLDSSNLLNTAALKASLGSAESLAIPAIQLRRLRDG